MTSEDRKQLSEIGYQVIDAKNEHVEKGWIVRVPNDDERVLISASEDEAWDAARDHHASMTREVTQAALEPCPFCGGKAEWKDDPGICDVPFGLVVDHKPDCFLAMPMSEEAMLAAWNTRLTAQSGEGRSGAGEDAGPFHVSQSGDGKKLWFSARDPASGVTIPARDRTDARNLVSSLNHACATFAALNARQSGEGEREAIDCEQLARAMNPPLWSDDEETAHRAASPLQVCYARDRAVEEAKVVLIERAALRATDDAGGA